jgi:hypothetical protein
MTDAPVQQTQPEAPPGRVYTSPGIIGRPTLSIVIVTAAAIYGVFELVRAWRGNFESQMDLLFGVFFVGGGIYGFNKTWNDNRDTVLTLDVDDATGRTALSLWRPFKPLLIETTLDRFRNWRHFVKVSPRGERAHLITAECADYPRPIRFEIQRGKPFPEGLRKVAPEAVREYEEAVGIVPAAD